MNETQFVPVAAWLAPVILAMVLFAIRRPSRASVTGIGLAIAWNLWSVLAVNVVALHFGWWQFDSHLPGFMGVPYELWLGWVALWGALAPLVGFDRPVPLVVTAFLWVDLLVMPALEPSVVLAPSWLIGEAVALCVALVPGLLLARWTIERTRLHERAALQVLCAGGLMLWLLPSIALRGSWPGAGAFTGWEMSAVVQVLVLPITLGLRAVIEFVRVGGGTPIPYDPPRRLVQSGPYAYVRNPMQVAMVLLFAIAAVPLRNPWMLAASGIALAYSVGLASWHENLELTERFGDDWMRYRSRVRPWLPRLRPVITDEATLLVAYSCGVCSSVGRWFLRRSPIGLSIAPAEESKDPGLRRVTYLPAGGRPEIGVAAIARALEHIHLGWALAGWFLALPGVVNVAQLISDVCGPGPQRVQGRSFDETSVGAPRCEL